jgi:hypothetical protein
MSTNFFTLFTIFVTSLQVINLIDRFTTNSASAALSSDTAILIDKALEHNDALNVSRVLEPSYDLELGTTPAL